MEFNWLIVSLVYILATVTCTNERKWTLCTKVWAEQKRKGKSLFLSVFKYLDALTPNSMLSKYHTNLQAFFTAFDLVWTEPLN